MKKNSEIDNDFYEFLNKMKKEYYDRINLILSQLENCNSVIKEKLFLYNNSKNNLEENKYLFNYYKKEFVNRSLAFILSLSITFGSAVGVFFISKKLSYKDYYKKNITTYSAVKGLNERTTLVEKLDVCNNNEKIYLNVCSSWEKNDKTYTRTVKRYDVSEYEFDYIESYLKYDIDYYEVDYELFEQNKESVNMNDFYLPEHIEVEKSVIDSSEEIERFDILHFMVLLPSLYSLYLFILYGFVYFTDYDFIFGQCCDAFSALLEINKNKRITKKELKLLKKLNDEILAVINENELLKIQFNGLYKNNKFLLDNPEELYNKFQELINQFNEEEVKKLIKKKA